MKIKLIAFMSVFCLVSFPALAENTTKEQNKLDSKQSEQHQNKKQKKKINSNQTEALTIRPATMMAVPGASNYFQPTMLAMTQNLGRAVIPKEVLFDRIGVTGGANLDGHWGNRHMGYMGENSRRVSLNDAYLNVTATINQWINGFASVSFNDTTGLSINQSEVIHSIKRGVYSYAYPNNQINLEQGFVTIGNFDCSPFFIQLGKQFQDFGRYIIHPIERTMTQVLSESLQTSAKIGFLTHYGLHGAVYGFEDLLKNEKSGNKRPVYGAALGFDHPCEGLGYDIGLGYMSSITGVNDVAYAVKTFERRTRFSDHVGTFDGTVGAWSAYGDLNMGPFGFSGRYATAAHKFTSTTLSTHARTVRTSGARPWAGDITAGYGFNAWTKDQNLYVGYQTSGNAVNILIPHHRWIAGYGIEVLPYTSLSAEYGHEQDYSRHYGGTGKSTNTVGARAAVKFS